MLGGILITYMRDFGMSVNLLFDENFEEAFAPYKSPCNIVISILIRVGQSCT